MCREKKDKFAERCEDQEAIHEKVKELVDIRVPNLWDSSEMGY